MEKDLMFKLMNRFGKAIEEDVKKAYMDEAGKKKDDKWMQKAFSKNKGKLHKALGVPEGEKIPVSKMRKALKDPKLKRMAILAINANPDVYGSLKKEMKSKRERRIIEGRGIKGINYYVGNGIYLVGVGRDVNGNSTISIKVPGKNRAITVQSKAYDELMPVAKVLNGLSKEEIENLKGKDKKIVDDGILAYVEKWVLKNERIKEVKEEKADDVKTIETKNKVNESREISKLMTAIKRAKEKLINKAKRKGGVWENFGQDEVRKLEDKFIDSSKYTDEMNIMRDVIQNFNEWCMSFELSQLEESKIKKIHNSMKNVNEEDEKTFKSLSNEDKANFKKEKLAKLEDELERKKEELENFELDEDDYIDEYNAMLDEQYGGDFFRLSPSYALKKADPIQYNQGLSDFVYSLDIEDDPKYQELETEIEELEELIEELREEIEEEEE